MIKKDFLKLISDGTVLLDGSIKVDCDVNECAEKWMLGHFDGIASQISAFREAGSNIIRCPSTGANRYQLERFGLADETVSINQELMYRTRKISGSHPVFGTISTTGKEIEPFGSTAFEDVITGYKEQAKALVESGADGFLVVMMDDIQEARAALIALRECGDFPVLVEMVFGPHGRTPGGTDPLSALITLQSLGADAVGAASPGAQEAVSAIIKTMKPFAAVPLLAFPSARDGSPESFCASGRELIDAGVNCIGGGENVFGNHIAALGSRIHDHGPAALAGKAQSALSSCRQTIMLGPQHPFCVVGERINPTGKKALQASLREGSMEMVEQLAMEQDRRRASILDVNMGLSGIDEMEMMLRALSLLSRISPRPLCIDTTRPDVVEAALRLYPGRALVNSVSGERERLERTLPVAARYGAMIIALPLTDAGIPATVKERIGVIDTILKAADPLGITAHDCAVDGLVMTISSNVQAANDTLDLIEWCTRSLHANTIVGLSNVSFGMPQRKWINGAFLGMAMGRGLTMAIANPSSDGIMATVQAYNSIMGHDDNLLVNSGVFKGIKE